MKDLFIAFLVKTLNITNDEAAALVFKTGENGQITEDLNDEALSAILGKDAARVEGIKNNINQNSKTNFDNGYKKGNKETAEKFERLIRSLSGFEGEENGEELLKQAFARASANENITPEKVKLSSVYLDLEQQLKQTKQSAKTELEQALEKLKKEFGAEKTRAIIGQISAKKLRGLNPVNSFTGENKETKFNNQIELFLKTEIASRNWAENNGEHILLNDDGGRVEDQHGHPVKLDSYLKNKASQYFDFATQSQKGNAGNENEGGDDSFKVPRNEQERNEAIFAAKNAEERQKINAAFEATKK